MSVEVVGSDPDVPGAPPSMPTPWEKVLYKRQRYPDNYVDVSFLESLVTNASVQPYALLPTMRAAAVLGQQMTAVVLFLLGYAALSEGALSLRAFAALQAASSCAVAGAVVAVLRRWPPPAAAAPEVATATSVAPPALGAAPQSRAGRGWADDALHGAVILGAMWVASPVIQTLTHSYARETVSACAGALCLLHVVFHEYRLAHACRSGVKGAFSLNAAMLAAALFASRLPTPAHVFAVLCLAVQLFALLPIARDAVRARSEGAFLALAAACAAAAAAACWVVRSPAAAAAYAAAAAVVTVACPASFIAMQPLKNEITGPWDVAHLVTPHGRR